jgi:hypothetical protein
MDNLNNHIDPTQNANTDPEEIQGAGQTDQKPHTPDDDYQDMGTTKEEVNGEDSNETPINKDELTELDKRTETDDDTKPTDFDIDESTG